MTKNCLLLVFVLKCSILLLNAQKVNETNFGSIGNPKQQPSKAIDAYSLTYNDFSEDSQGSLPIGNGDIGLNVWTEKNGDILFYIGKSDSWSEAKVPELVKVGRVRISLYPNPFQANKNFSQTLKISESSVTINGDGTTVKIWVDANAPAIRVESVSKSPVSMKVTLDPWRTVAKDDVSADTVLPNEKDKIIWYHRINNPKLTINMLTFGALMKGNGLVREEGNMLKSISPLKTQSLVVIPFTSIENTVSDWKSKIELLADKNEKQDTKQAWQLHCAWWDKFWDRSHIYLNGDSLAVKVSAGYNYQRYLSGCSGRGGYPMKFNGTIFNMDYPKKTGRDKITNAIIPTPMNADFRDWGGRYWMQNTRAMYWPLLQSGDYDLMLPFFNFYKNILPKNTSLVKEYYGHDGGYFAECTNIWGGLNKLTKQSKGYHLGHYYLPILELSSMMFDYYTHTRDEKFVKETFLPIVNSGLTFYSQHFDRDSNGKILLDSVNATEMYWKVVNPTPDISALHFLLPRLLALPEGIASQKDIDFWKKLQTIIPDIPKGQKNGKEVILPYAGPQTAPLHNFENPELYSIHPFRQFGIDKPFLDIAMNTYEVRLFKKTKCWYQDAIDEAYLGLAEQAKRDVIITLTNKEPRMRFPGFWDKGHDFAPDGDNGGNGQHALQLMLMQSEDKKIILLPAWPKDWEANFKLHAPYNTTVEAKVKNGKISNLRVTPKERMADIIMADGSKP